MRMVSEPVTSFETRCNHKSARKYQRAITEAGFTMSVWAGQLFDTLRPEVPKNTVLHVGRVRVADMGFVGPVLQSDFITATLSRGYSLCPAECGPALRLVYREQPPGERVVVATKPLSDARGRKSLFCLERFEAGPCHLSAVVCGGVHVWPNEMYVFQVPRH